MKLIYSGALRRDCYINSSTTRPRKTTIAYQDYLCMSRLQEPVCVARMPSMMGRNPHSGWRLLRALVLFALSSFTSCQLDDSFNADAGVDVAGGSLLLGKVGAKSGKWEAYLSVLCSLSKPEGTQGFELILNGKGLSCTSARRRAASSLPGALRRIGPGKGPVTTTYSDCTQLDSRSVRLYLAATGTRQWVTTLRSTSKRDPGLTKLFPAKSFLFPGA